MTDVSARLGLPMLAAGQAQKEVTHNEALALLDLVVAAGVVETGVDSPPGQPLPGQAWIVGAAPMGVWTGRAGAIAGWTAGGWRFVAPFEGLRVWVAPERLEARFTGGVWVKGEVRASRVLVDGAPVLAARQPAIDAPSGGAVVDTEARAGVAAVLAALRAHGLIAS